MLAQVPAVDAMLQRARQLDEGFGAGAIWEALLSLESARAGVKPDVQQERMHRFFEKALALSKGEHASTFVSYAENASVPAQDRARFQELLGKALAIDADRQPQNRLANLISQRRARWLLARTDELFLGTCPNKLAHEKNYATSHPYTDRDTDRVSRGCHPHGRATSHHQNGHPRPRGFALVRRAHAHSRTLARRLRRPREAGALPRRRAGRRAGPGQQDAHRPDSGRGALGRGHAGYRQGRSLPADPHDVRFLRGAGLRPRPHRAAPGKDHRGTRIPGAQLGRRRMGALLYQDPRRTSWTNCGAEAVHLGRRQR